MPACPVKNVRADLADATVMEIIREAARDPKMLSAAVEEANRIAQQTVAPLRERVASMKRDLAAAERTAEATLDTLLRVGLSDSPTAKRRLAEAEEKVRQVRLALAEAEGELAVREGEQLDAEVMAQALGSFDEAFDHLTSDERREFLRLMIKQVTVYKDRIVVDLYEGRQATGYLVAVTTGAQTDEEAAKARNPGRVDQGFVTESRWLPAHAQMRTRGRRDRPVFWLGVPLLLDRSRLKKKGKKTGSSRSKAPAKPSIEATRAKMQALLDTGEVASRAELARHLKVSRAYVTQVLGPMVHAVHALEGETPSRATAATHGDDT